MRKETFYKNLYLPFAIMIYSSPKNKVMGLFYYSIWVWGCVAVSSVWLYHMNQFWYCRKVKYFFFWKIGFFNCKWNILCSLNLQILSMVNDLHIFEPTSVETLEFYVCLEQFLKPADNRSGVSWKVISLLSHISHSPTVRVALR